MTKQVKVLLHSCCAPCSTSSFEKLSIDYPNPVIFWYNPNIEDEAEHDKRFSELAKLAKMMSFNVVGEYDYQTENKLWHETVAGFELEPEGGKRCLKCFEFRLKKTAGFAKKNNYDLFTTTLTVSPYKNADEINRIGKEISKLFLESDFKKNNGYSRSIVLSKDFGLYRQKYCGCQYSESVS